MKPSPAAPWTFEDAMVWRRFELTIGDLAVWRYVHADRRDAALMYSLGHAAQLCGLTIKERNFLYSRVLQPQT